MGATAEGKKELIAVADGYREGDRAGPALDAGPAMLGAQDLERHG
jgi:hypothetical protein